MLITTLCESFTVGNKGKNNSLSPSWRLSPVHVQEAVHCSAPNILARVVHKSKTSPKERQTGRVEPAADAPQPPSGTLGHLSQGKLKTNVEPKYVYSV